jgi:hypothetical protein
MPERFLVVRGRLDGIAKFNPRPGFEAMDVPSAFLEKLKNAKHGNPHVLAELRLLDSKGTMLERADMLVKTPECCVGDEFFQLLGYLPFNGKGRRYLLLCNGVEIFETSIAANPPKVTLVNFEITKQDFRLTWEISERKPIWATA